MLPENTPAVLARFWGKVERKGADECWEWQAAKHDRGNYGIIRIDGRSVRANRWSLEQSLGRSLGPGMVARHTCDNPPCVNPAHLIEGTTADNVEDKVSRNRQKVGEMDPNSKLTDDAVLEIREAISSGVPQMRLARRFGVAQGLISRVATGNGWKHVGGPITSGINKSHCAHGHAYTPENILWRNGGTKRICRQCNKVHQSKYKNRIKENQIGK